MPKIVNYTIKSIKTGETYTGRPRYLSKEIDYSETGFSRAYKADLLIHGEWKITDRYDETVDGKKDEHMYDYLTAKNLRHLDKKKVKALYDSYKSGRSDFWTVPRIAKECGVPTKEIEKVLNLV